MEAVEDPDVTVDMVESGGQGFDVRLEPSAEQLEAQEQLAASLLGDDFDLLDFAADVTKVGRTETFPEFEAAVGTDAHAGDTRMQAAGPATADQLKVMDAAKIEADKMKTAAPGAEVGA